MPPKKSIEAMPFEASAREQCDPVLKWRPVTSNTTRCGRTLPGRSRSRSSAPRGMLPDIEPRLPPRHNTPSAPNTQTMSTMGNLNTVQFDSLTASKASRGGEEYDSILGASIASKKVGKRCSCEAMLLLYLRSEGENIRYSDSRPSGRDIP